MNLSSSINNSKLLITSTLLIFISILNLYSCNDSKDSRPTKNKKNEIICTDNFCSGSYNGPEFVNGIDVAHQHSNKMSSEVGIKLKQLFDEKKYSKVDFPNIKMTTKGMGTGIVTYELRIPFVRVSSKCKSYTSFDHVGGWNHTPELEKRKQQLNNALLQGDKLNISNLKRTKEGLQEYWIQWRNKDKQRNCIMNE